MNRGNWGRRLLLWIITGAACLFFCLPAALGIRAAGEDIPTGGSITLLVNYPAGDGTIFYAMDDRMDRKLDAIAATGETGTLPAWTVQRVDGGVSLSAGGLYLGYSGEEDYFSSQSEPYVWQVISGENGTFRLCTGSGRAIGYKDNEGNGRFGVYDLGDAWDSEYCFELQISATEEPEAPEETTQPEETTEPEETTRPAVPEFPTGTGILWVQNQQIALCGIMDGNGYFPGTEVAEADGTLTGYTSQNIWTVALISDNTLKLLHAGKTLSLPEEESDLVWDGPHSTWAAVYQQDGTWLLENATRLGCYLGWNPMVGIWSAGPLPEADLPNYSFTFTPAAPEVELPVVSKVSFSPEGGELYPAGGAEIRLETDTPGASIYYALSPDGITYGEFALYTQPIQPEAGFGRFWVRAYASAPDYENSAETTCQFTERTGDYGFYFGLLHAHTEVSDGLGTVAEAFAQASGVEDLDFFAVTDHSNSFDSDTLGALNQDGTSLSQAWRSGKAAAQSVTNGEFVGLYGFEMTWNNGLGHISTFGTPGWASRNQSAYQDLHTALETYYADLASVPGSVSQFNHPGAFYGDFEQFGHYSPEADRAITLMEVFNSDAGDSWDAYIRALDLGWHLAPTCSQDNHAGQFGSLDDGRTVVLANTLTEENLLSAMENYRVYATKDKDLEILYTLDGKRMGSRLFDYGSQVTIQVSVRDITDGNEASLEVIGSGGTVALTQSVSGSTSVNLPSDSPYYLLRVTQADGDVAVTAPIWLEQEAPLEITKFAADSAITVARETQTFTVEIANALGTLSNAVIAVTDSEGRVLATETLASLPGGAVTSWSFPYRFPQDGAYTLTITLTAGSRTISRELTVTVLPRSILSDVIVDGTHGAVVAAENLIAVAEEFGFRAHMEKNQITAAQLEHCALLIVPAPAVEFEADFGNLVADFVAQGGNVLLCGASDAALPGTAARMNALLEAIGSTMTLSDDRVYDPASNGGSPDVIFTERYNPDSPWAAGIREGQVYSHRAGCSVNPGSGTWLVKGLATTFSLDGDGNGLERSGETYRGLILDDSDDDKSVTHHLVKSAGDICLMAAEETDGGTVFLSGGGMPFDEAMQLETDNLWDLFYANRQIYENILGIPVREVEITPISQVRAAEAGRVFLMEGWVTAGTGNPHNCLPDTIYIQDATGGIALVPYSKTGLALGTKVRVAGTVNRVRGDIRLEIVQLSVLDGEKNVIEPGAVDNAAAMDYAASGGNLVRLQGTVTEVIYTADGLGVAEFTLVDDRGTEARVLIEDSIRSGTTGLNHLEKIVRQGNRVRAAGLVYCREAVLLRVRNCDEVELLWAPAEVPPATEVPTEGEAEPSEQPKPPTNGSPDTADPFPLEIALICVTLSFAALCGLGKRRI